MLNIEVAASRAKPHLRLNLGGNAPSFSVVPHRARDLLRFRRAQVASFDRELRVRRSAPIMEPSTGEPPRAIDAGNDGDGDGQHERRNLFVQQRGRDHQAEERLQQLKLPDGCDAAFG